ncbi:Hypothetical predicted protein [Cloeon dipterum]|uniref:Uncharacterized protein n=1 Tax=Cloeon dipterum TaxID=197152 RepID=A0A8S1CKT1_9INSE|nr:Hypothetical predicted protein [Cloeon dipterum]
MISCAPDDAGHMFNYFGAQEAEPRAAERARANKSDCFHVLVSCHHHYLISGGSRFVIFPNFALLTNFGSKMVETHENQGADEDVIVMYKQRLQTFGDKGLWFEIGPASRENMAKHGFFCQNNENRKNKTVHCAYCHQEFANWARQDDPKVRHLEESPNCPFVKCGKEEGDLTVKEFLEIELAVKISLMVRKLR